MSYQGISWLKGPEQESLQNRKCDIKYGVPIFMRCILYVMYSPIDSKLISHLQNLGKNFEVPLTKQAIIPSSRAVNDAFTSTRIKWIKPF